MKIADDFYAQLAAKLPRRLAFRPECLADFPAWQARVRGKLRELLKLDPPAAASGSEIVARTEADGLAREKALIHDPLFGPIPIFILKPAGQRAPAPGILCLHGHGGYFAGKDLVSGNPEAPAIARECAAALNYSYGAQLARAGFVAACPDAWNFGERMFGADLGTKDHVCDRYFAELSAFGFSPAGVTTRGNCLALDHLLGRPDVKPGCAGCVGLSYGGFQALLLAAADSRVGAAVISGAAFSYAGSLVRKGMCGAQIIPGALEWFDLPDLAASLAPRPALWEMMRRDRCFDFDRSRRFYLQLSEVYRRVGAGDEIQSDTADTDHRYIGRRAPEFFRRHLG